MAGAPLQLHVDAVFRVSNMAWVENRGNRTTKPDECAAIHRGGACCERFEHKPRPVVIKQNATLKVTDDYRLRQLGHQRCQTVLFFFNYTFGLGNLCLDIINIGITLTGQIIDGANKFTQLGRPFLNNAERTVRAKHHA